ncbi:unnamed protein product, partial [Discosporangium mesarthrocarpum]
LDIGSGIGSIVLQAAAWAGCAAVGVEIVPKRHECATELHGALLNVLSANSD